MTKVYIYEQANRDVSSMYHSDGGVVIITDRDPAEAFEEWAKANLPEDNLADYPLAMTGLGMYVQEDGKPYPRWVSAEDRVPEGLELAAPCDERVIVFPNAGCC